MTAAKSLNCEQISSITVATKSESQNFDSEEDEDNSSFFLNSSSDKPLDGLNQLTSLTAAASVIEENNSKYLFKSRHI